MGYLYFSDIPELMSTLFYRDSGMNFIEQYQVTVKP